MTTGRKRKTKRDEQALLHPAFLFEKRKSMRLRELKSIGEKREKAFEKLGVTTAEELVRYYPRAYLDLTERASAVLSAASTWRWSASRTNEKRVPARTP